MSRIGKAPISVPSGVEVSINGRDVGTLIFRGATGEVEMDSRLHSLWPVGDHELERESRNGDRVSFCRNVEHPRPEPSLRCGVQGEAAERAETDRHTVIQRHGCRRSNRGVAGRTRRTNLPRRGGTSHPRLSA